MADVRVRTFAQEAADRLGFLSAVFGFTGPETMPGETGPYPLLRRVRFRRAELAVEISLVLAYMGEEYVAADLVTEDGTGSVHRAEIGRGTAHTGYQMRRMLDLQAEAVRRAVRERAQSSRDWILPAAGQDDSSRLPRSRRISAMRRVTSVGA